MSGQIFQQALRGKSVIVTGSTSGIGWGIASAFAKAGARVMLHGLESLNQVSHLTKELSGISNEPTAYTSANLIHEPECQKLVEETTKAFGQVDIVVNNAGLQYTSRTESFPTEKWDLVLGICLNAPFYMSKAALPGMYERKWGRLVHIGSAHSQVASPNKSAYCAAKHGVLGLSRSIALEAAGTGVTSNVICPGWVLTPLVQAQIEKISKEKGISIEDAKKELVLDKHPTPEFVDPENLGSFAVYLSTENAKQINGAALSMDLGWTVR